MDVHVLTAPLHVGLALELNAAMPLSSGFLADVFCCDLED
jgi:hypothetical protein